MEKIQNWAFSLCCASIAGSLLNIILPEGSLQKTFKTVLCVFFLCILVSPFAKTDFINDDFTFFNNRENEYDLSENIFTGDSLEILKNEIIAETEGVLDNYGIYDREISFSANISEDGSIDITEFTVLIKNSVNVSATEKAVFKKTGIRPDIISGENENG